jgi:hypothetical protein
MKDKKNVCGETARRYQKADKKGKGKLLDEYTATLSLRRTAEAAELARLIRAILERHHYRYGSLRAREKLRRGPFQNRTTA